MAAARRGRRRHSRPSGSGSCFSAAMVAKPCVVDTTHSARNVFVLETRIENVSCAAHRERWGMVEGQKKSKIQATCSPGTDSGFMDPEGTNLRVGTAII